VMRGLMSSPYSNIGSSSSSPRHKRNHNSKLHSNHHHSHDLSSLDGGSSSSGNIGTRITNNNFKAHTSLSFRNEEDSLKSWHLNDHNKSLRQRRSTEDLKKQSTEDDEQNSIASATAFIEVPDDGSEVSDIDDDDQVIKLVRNKRGASNSSGGGIMEIASDAGTDPTRSRRDTTINCGNVNTRRRQLNIGCSDGTKIDVSPQCDDGEEGEMKFNEFCVSGW
jgi:hypothetical protein